MDACRWRLWWRGLAAPSVRDQFSGIEFADSFIVDPHKNGCSHHLIAAL